MLNISSSLRAQFEAYLQEKAIPKNNQAAYQKWLRYYLDFCRKYNFTQKQRGSLTHFLVKLQEKKQTKAQQDQASHSISLYYELILAKDTLFSEKVSLDKTSHCFISSPDAVKDVSLKSKSFHYQTSNIAAPRPKKPGVKEKVLSKPLAGASWRSEYTELANEIRVRHYSPKTLKTYKQWMRQFQTYTRSKPPALLSTADVKEFLTSLAVKRHVSASTQNQAFNALLFFFRHVLHKEFGKVDGVVRAKRKRYIPVVLSREEIETILTYLAPPYDLIVKLLYGCGLRLFECLQLRVHCLNFDMGWKWGDVRSERS